MKLIYGFCTAGFLFSCAAESMQADDWPQWRGPQRNGISQETGLLKAWPEGGPKLHWKISGSGSGYAAPSVVGERIYLMANDGLENEFVQALSVKDGSRLWSTRLGAVGNPKQKPNYPAARSTPTVEGELLFALGSDGDLVCLETESGKVRWKKNLRVDFSGQPGDWAYSESPLVHGDAVICTPGGAKATLVALDKRTGELLWRSPLPEAGNAAFASAIVVENGGAQQIVQLLEKGLFGVEAKTGASLWRYDKAVSRFRANIPTPVAGDGYIYTASAGTGGGVVRVINRDGNAEVEQVYFELKMPTAIGGVVKVGKFLYGTTGQALFCIEFATGRIMWEDRGLGAASICYADGSLYLHGENGDVALVEASAERYREKGRFTPPNRPELMNTGEKSWAYPVVANGRFYVREHGTLWCYEVTAARR